MKKLFLLVGVLVVFFSCASTPAIKSASDVSPTALISVATYDEITWYGEKKESHGLLGNLIAKKVEKAVGEDPATLLPVFMEELQKRLSSKGIQIAEPSKILQSNSYMSAKEDKLAQKSNMIAPKGYKIMSQTEKGDFAKIAKENGLKSGVYCIVDFQKMISTGVAKNGTAKASVSMTLFMLNAEGKIILQKTYFGQSKETFPVVGGIYDPKKLMELLPEAIKVACDEFAQSLMK